MTISTSLVYRQDEVWFIVFFSNKSLGYKVQHFVSQAPLVIINGYYFLLIFFVGNFFFKLLNALYDPHGEKKTKLI